MYGGGMPPQGGAPGYYWYRIADRDYWWWYK